MARFWILEDRAGTTVGAALSRKAAKAQAQALGLQPGDYSLTSMQIAVTPETIRRLLSGEGGYATHIRHEGSEP